MLGVSDCAESFESSRGASISVAFRLGGRRQHSESTYFAARYPACVCPCQRGVGKDLAAQTAGSPLGPWRLANTPALHLALPTAYFDSLGIPRLLGALT
jgi:hypothetical protein